MGEAWRGVWGAAMGEAWRGCGNPVLWAREMGLSDGRLGVVWGCPQREWLSLIFLSVDFLFFPFLIYSILGLIFAVMRLFGVCVVSLTGDVHVRSRYCVCVCVFLF